MSKSNSPYSLGEEIANSITHGTGIVLAIIGLAVLTAFASAYGNARHIVGVSVFGAAMIVMYTASTLYHSIPHPRAKQLLRIFDHAAIFVLIAGTYTPFTLVTLQGPLGWVLFGIVWGLAAIGIVLQIVSLERMSFLSLFLYLGMGWAVIFAIKPILAALPSGGLTLLVLGGLAYTVGVIFYVWRRPYFHAIWHGFVLTGTAFHYFAILLYVIPILH